MSDSDEVMDFEYQSDENDDVTYLKLSKQYKRRHCGNSEYPKKQRRHCGNSEYPKKQRRTCTTEENRDIFPVEQISFPRVENWDEIYTSDNQTTKPEENHALPNLDNTSEGNGKKNEEMDQEDESTETQKVLTSTMQYSRNMHRSKSVPVVVPEISKNGWVLFVNSLHEEVTEIEVRNLFADYGEIGDIRLSMCRRTGFVDGYALIQYNTYADALKAKEALHNTEFLGRKICVDWCFLQSPKN